MLREKSHSGYVEVRLRSLLLVEERLLGAESSQNGCTLCAIPELLEPNGLCPTSACHLVLRDRSRRLAKGTRGLSGNASMKVSKSTGSRLPSIAFQAR